MLNDISFGQYIPGISIIHKLDPRVKILLVCSLMLLIFLVNSYTGYLVFYVFITLSIGISHIPVKYVLKGLRPIAVLIVITAVLNIFFTSGGTPLFTLGIIRVSAEGVHNAVKLSLKLILLLTSASLLTLTTTPILLADGLERLMNPLKKVRFPVHEIAMMMTIALRFIPTLLEETDKIMKAQASRGADFDTGNILERAKSFVPVLIPLFVSAFRRADDLALAMEARCYRGGEGRTRMKQLKFKKEDLIVIIITIVFAAILLLFA